MWDLGFCQHYLQPLAAFKGRNVGCTDRDVFVSVQAQPAGSKQMIQDAVRCFKVAKKPAHFALGLFDNDSPRFRDIC